MAAKPFSKEQLNFFKLSTLVFDEVPKVLRQIFITMWDSKIAIRPGFIPWDDSTKVRNMLCMAEGGKTAIPTMKSIEEWDSTALFYATIYAKTFAVPDRKGSTLYDVYLRKHNTAGSFHSSVQSPTGNQDETYALAIDQLRLLRNRFSHFAKPEIIKTDFDHYVHLVTNALTALNVDTAFVNIIGQMSEHDFPTEKVEELQVNSMFRENLEQKLSSIEDRMHTIEKMHTMKKSINLEEKGNMAANITEIQWTKTSTKHRSLLSELVGLLKTEPSKATKIGAWIVCFDDKFSIGKGSNNTKVYLGLSEDGCEVAVKYLDLRTCLKVGETEKSILKRQKVKKEKHIVNYLHYHQVDPEKAYLILDLYEQSLQDYVKSKERPVEVLRKEGPTIIRQILYGVKTLHDGDPEILHRDLKPSNILVDMEGEMVLADFGISRTLPKDETTYKSGVSGTEGWMAVESLPTEDDEDDDSIPYEAIRVRYKKKSDIQVVGMLSYYILTKGQHPYGRRTHRSYNISKGYSDLKDITNPCAKDLITWMLQHDPAKRPNVHECLKHPYLQEPEENFSFVTLVGNEAEIINNDETENVVQELNRLPGFTGWLGMIDACVMNFMTFRRPYTSNVTDLFRFIRNMDTHWRDNPPPANVQTTVIRPQEYFERIFPTLAVDVYRIIREDPTWTTREKLMKFFHQP